MQIYTNSLKIIFGLTVVVQYLKPINYVIPINVFAFL